MNTHQKAKFVMKNEKLSKVQKLRMAKKSIDQAELHINRKQRAPIKAAHQEIERSEKIHRDFEKVDEVNRLMLDAIKAKLAILDH